MKTYAREIAVALMLLVGWFIYDGDVQMVQALAWPVLTFASAAFAGKHLSNGMLGNTSS
jgi:hypothetical protein